MNTLSCTFAIFAFAFVAQFADAAVIKGGVVIRKFDQIFKFILTNFDFRKKI